MFNMHWATFSLHVDRASSTSAIKEVNPWQLLLQPVSIPNQLFYAVYKEYWCPIWVCIFRVPINTHIGVYEAQKHERMHFFYVKCKTLFDIFEPSTTKSSKISSTSQKWMSGEDPDRKFQNPINMLFLPNGLKNLNV